MFKEPSTILFKAPIVPENSAEKREAEIIEDIESAGLDEKMFFQIDGITDEQEMPRLMEYVQNGNFEPCVINRMFNRYNGYPRSPEKTEKFHQVIEAFLNMAFKRKSTHTAYSESMIENEDFLDPDLQELIENDRFFFQLYKEIRKRYDEIEDDSVRKHMDILIAELEKSKSEAGILAMILKRLKEENREVNFDDIKDFGIQEKEIGQDMAQNEKEEILDMFKENYKDIFKNNPEAERKVLDDISQALANIEKQKTYTLKFQGKVVAFCRFEPMAEPDMAYGGSLNMEKEVQGLAIGNYFLENVLLEESKNNSIKIKTRSNRTAQYKKLGFNVMGDTFKEKGVEYYYMILPKQNQLERAA